MRRCSSCDFENVSGTDRCEKCGAWFTRSSEGKPEPGLKRAPMSSQPFPPADTLEGRVLRLLQQQQKIAAIKLYREETSAGLKEAKDAVEALAAAYGMHVKAAGCGSAVLAIGLFTTLLARMVYSILN